MKTSEEMKAESDARIPFIHELAALELRLDDGTASMADLSRAVKLILKLNGMARTE